MQKKPTPTILAKISSIGLLCLIGGFIAYKLYSPKKVKKIDLDFAETQTLLLKLNERLSKIWFEGEYQGLIDAKLCPDLVKKSGDYHSSYLECNPIALGCFFKSQQALAFSVDDVSATFKVKELKYRSKSLYLNLLIPEGNLKEAFGDKIHFNFPLRCHTRYLPRKPYPFGLPDDDQQSWSSDKLDIYIDRFYVTRGEVHLWKVKKLLGLKDLVAPYKPELALSFEEKQQFCADRGGQLLESRTLNAATYFPNEKNIIFRSFYPWSKERTYLRPVVEFLRSDCEKLYSKECMDLSPYIYHSTYSPSWMGIYHSLGSFPEVVRNTFAKNWNLAPSSMNYSRLSKWHRIGLRAKFEGTDGVDFYNGATKIVEEVSFKGAFRCQYYNL